MSRDITQTVRVCIGTEPKTYIPQKVLECSIARRTEAKVEFYPLIGPEWEYPSDIKVGTGFSLRRWLIPEHFGWEGRALYLDADQLVLHDILDLWNKPETAPGPPGTSAWMTFQPDKFSTAPWPQSSVMVIDCAAAKVQWGWRKPFMLRWLRENPTQKDYAGFMHCDWMKPPPRQIENGWNGLNIHNQGKTRLVHYTREDWQPWYKPDHPLAGLWQQELTVAIRMGYVTEDDIRGALAKWNVKEDWRPTNGLNPYYGRFLKEAAA